MNHLKALLPLLPLVLVALWLSTRYRWFLGVFLIAHALVHVMYFVPEPDGGTGLDWPFHLDRSWLLSGQSMKTVGTVLAAAAGVAFLTAGIGVLVDVAWWPAVAAAASVVSLLVLIGFLQPMIALGILINAFVLTVALWAWPSVQFMESGLV